MKCPCPQHPAVKRLVRDKEIDPLICRVWAQSAFALHPAAVRTVGPNLQVENRCEVHQPSRPPPKGALPLPSGLDQSTVDYKPSRLEDLNELLPEEGPRLATPTRPAQVRFSC